MSDDPTKAAFGIYPSSGKRPERLNQSRDVNVPLQLARGWTAGLLGLPGDIEGLVRMLPGIKEETPVLPTSDFYREYLPGYDPKPFARAVSGLGALSGGVGATRVAGRVAEAAKPENIRQYVRQTQGLTGLPGTAVIKPKGGNWLEGSIEKSTSKWTEDLEPMNLGEITERHGEQRAQEMLRQYQESPRYRQQNAINKWVDKKLNKYIRNEMATPEDPVRKLAEQNILHIDPEQVGINRYRAPEKRNIYGGQQLGVSDAAKAWEDATDVAINAPKAGDIKYPSLLENNPWLAKVDPEQRVYALNTPASHAQEVEGLGFDHLIDELRNAINPNSDLPANLRWKPEDLDKVTMAQAVERVSKINDWRAAQMEAAKKAAREGIPVHKQYEGGYQWMAAPDTAKDPKSLKYIQDVGCESGWCTQGESLARQYGGGGNQLYVLHDPNGKSVVQISVKPGRPWNQRSGIFYDHPELEAPWATFSKEVNAAAREKGVDRDPNYIVGFPDWLAKNQPEVFAKYKSVFQESPAEIVEIKGRQNRPPKEEHLPMVQDFVRSGNWSRVGDLDNTGLFQVGNKYFNQSEIKSMTEPAIRFLEEAPMLNRHRQAMQTYRNFKGPIPSPEFDALNREIDKIVDPSIPYTYSELVGILHEPKAYGIDSLGKVLEAVERLKAMSGQNYAVGGLVQNTDTLRDKLIAAGMDPEQAMMQALRMADQVEMAEGGLVKEQNFDRGGTAVVKNILSTIAKPAVKSRVPSTPGFTQFVADAPLVRADEANKFDFQTGRPVIVESYSGTRRDFSEIDPGLSSAGYFSSNKPIVANEYAGVFPEGAVSQPFPTGGNIQKSFIRMDNPLFINARGASFNRVDTRGLPGFGLPMSNTDMINLWAKQQGYDGVVYKDLRDSMALPGGQNAPASNVYVSFKPNYVKSAIGNRGTYDIKEKDMTKAEGGPVDADEQHFQVGGKVKEALKKFARKSPLLYPPVPPLSKAEIRPYAQRMSEQMSGDFFRPDPLVSVNPAGKSRKTFEREKTLPIVTTERVKPIPAEKMDYESLEDALVIGIPGDPTLGGIAKPGALSSIHEGAVELNRLGDVEFRHPVQLFGGNKFGSYDPENYWASNKGVASRVQGDVTDLGALGPVYGQYIKMAPSSSNYALHNLDALLAYIEPEKLSKSKLRQLNQLIREGSPTYGKFQDFQGLEDPIDVLLQTQLNVPLRKHIAETLLKSSVTEPLNLRPGSDVVFGISDPRLRNLELGASGASIGKMRPGASLTESLHPTYSHNIPGTYVGESRYPVPLDLAFPTTMSYIRTNKTPGTDDFYLLSRIGARERIDPQYIDQIKMYEELMKQYTGKKEGGLVGPEGAEDFAKQVMQKITNQQVSA